MKFKEMKFKEMKSIAFVYTVHGYVITKDRAIPKFVKIKLLFRNIKNGIKKFVWEI